jgi:hypothetical protein
MRGWLLAAGTALVIGVSGCGTGGEPGEEVSRDEMGNDWPLTVESGTLRCAGESGLGAATIEVDGSRYALNGIAKAQNAGQDIQPIWASSDDGTGLKKSIGPLIDRALALCE